MHRLISRFRAFFRRKADPEEERDQKRRLLQAGYHSLPGHSGALQASGATADVDAYCDGHGDDPSASHMTMSLDCITSLIDDADHINHELFFSLDIVCKDFEPYKGDLVEIEFSEQRDTQSRKAILMKPLKHHHVNEVCVTRVDGRTGVLEDTIFFTLDSLKLPSGYVPQPDDIVNVVAVQSIQSQYLWRAVVMAPVQGT
ncbi:cancer/testis antigen 55-like [Peromyscus leucopus]|uniref:cancer/testis antigen 55-like n=1 Tax=Peromyscus leucopus TaxID=10041 RepID=UPI0018851739|nr:cancer/testis antigen 55-like [Peromyscus leucopus]